MLKSRCAMVEQVDFQHFDLVLVPTFHLKVWYHYWYQGIANFWLFLVCPKNKKPRNHYDFEVLIVFDFYLAEEEGFEPPEPFGSTVFKTAAFDRSATPLCTSSRSGCKCRFLNYSCKILFKTQLIFLNITLSLETKL
jgi:hypothetical protein